MPAKNQFLSKLRDDQEVHDTFLLLQKQLASGKTGRNYLRLTLGDRSGQMEARVWEGAEQLAPRFEPGDLVYVTGNVNSFQGILQIKAQFLERLDAADAARVDWSDYLPASERDPDEMFAELSALLGTIANPYLKRLLDGFLGDGEFVRAFRRAPAAKGLHHAYVAGLLEHTLGVVKLADRVAPLYPVHRDLLLAGAFLHDIGKVEELSSGAGFDYTDAGRFVGHIVLGARLVRSRAEAIEGFPELLLLHLDHLIISHHGELEWGSPKRPKTVEALLLHALDNLDAKTQAALEAIRKAETQAGDWTGFAKLFERPLYRPSLGGPSFGEGLPGEAPPVEEPVVEQGAKTREREETKEKETPAPVGKAPEEAVDKDPGAGQGSLGF
jgi:3'-5' exoribonuclease